MNKILLLLIVVASQASQLNAQEINAYKNHGYQKNVFGTGAIDNDVQQTNGLKLIGAHQPAKLAMGDMRSIQSSLNDNSTSQASNKKWAQLSDEQRKVLAPLGAEWDTLRPWQREKMLDIASDYPKMDAQKQQRVQQRLNSWSRMTPYERENARKRYLQFYALSADKQDEVRKKWADYQKLSPAEREKIRKESPELAYDPELE